MANNKSDQVIMPLGWLAGQPVRLADALWMLGTEMLGHRSDLMMLATDKRLSDLERECYQKRAIDLERYATAVNALSLQVDPERWQTGDYSGLLELARQNTITLPSWMTEEK